MTTRHPEAIMQHPIHFLSPNGELDGRSLRLLDENCSSQSPDPTDPSRTIFTFLAHHVFDVRDRIIVADLPNGTYTTERAPNCACDQLRTPIECGCIDTTCYTCGQPFTAMETICASTYCLYDQCPLCEHQRESCHAETIEPDIIELRDQMAIQSPTNTAADHMHAAISAVLGAGAVDAPNYPVTRRILSRHLQSTEANAWTAPDGSRIHIDPTRPAWLSLA